MARLHRPLALLAPLALAACGGSHLFTDGEIPAITKFDDVMWSQAQAADPAFKRIGAAVLADADFAVAQHAGERLKLTSARLRQKDLSKGAEFDGFAEQLGARAEELSAAAAAKDAARTQSALSATRDTCRACHKKFK